MSHIMICHVYVCIFRNVEWKPNVWASIKYFNKNKMRVRRLIQDVVEYYYPLTIILMGRRNREQVAMDVPKGVCLFCYLSHTLWQVVC